MKSLHCYGILSIALALAIVRASVQDETYNSDDDEVDTGLLLASSLASSLSSATLSATDSSSDASAGDNGQLTTTSAVLNNDEIGAAPATLTVTVTARDDDWSSSPTSDTAVAMDAFSDSGTATAMTANGGASASPTTSVTESSTMGSALLTETVTTMQTGDDGSVQLLTLTLTLTLPSSASGTASQPTDSRLQSFRQRISDWFRKGGSQGKALGGQAANQTENYVKAGYYDIKLKTMRQGVHFLVDYAFALESWLQLGSACQTNNATHQSQQPLDSQTLGLAREALGVFLRPLKTYQLAESSVDDRKLGSSLIGMERIVTVKPPNQTVAEGDWSQGTMWSSVVRRVDVDAVLSYRDSLFQWYGQRSGQPSMDVRNQDADRHNRSMNYFKSLMHRRRKYDVGADGTQTYAVEDNRWQFRKLVSKQLDWDAYESRYLDIVTRVLVLRPDLLGKCRRYLARFLYTGDSAEGYYRDLVQDLSGVAPGADAAPTGTQTAPPPPAPLIATATATAINTATVVRTASAGATPPISMPWPALLLAPILFMLLCF
jgi:hypothetical protein